jgi:sialate O-acetylesterase
MRFTTLLRSTLLVIVTLGTLRAEVTLAPIFSDHAVLQRGKPIPIWGWADPGEKITVKFVGNTQRTQGGSDGKWRVDLPALEADAKGQNLSVSGSNEIELHDILIGDVWLCGGQSNMEWTVQNSRDAQQEIAAADFPLIRHLKVTKRIANDPITTLSGEWTICTPDTAGDYTAVGYFFARRLHADLSVPIGLLNSNWGGTPVEAWLPPEVLTDPAMAVAVASHQAKINQGILAQNTAYRDQLEAWETSKAAAATNNESFDQQPPRMPWQPGPFKTATVLYNGMIEPLIPYALAGFIWYQGEGNAGQPETYHDMFAALITSWRNKFQQPDAPFYWAQLASWDSGGGESLDWPLLREAQHQTLALPHTGQAILTDIGEAFDIHPRNKQDVGDRLARVALAEHYGHDVVARGPSYRSTSYRGSEITITFDHAPGLTTSDGQAPREFEIAGVGGVFHPAAAALSDHQVTLTSEAVPAPRNVRYAWHRWIEPNLQNAAGLPAEPFRTDVD